MTKIPEVGLILPLGAVSAMDSFLTATIKHLTESLKEKGYGLVLFDYARYELAELERLRLERSLSGVVLFSPSKDDSKQLDKLIQSGIPVVIVFSHYEGIDSFTCANEEGGYIATKYLLESGRKRIAFMHGHPNWLDSYDRYTGFRRALTDADALFHPEYVANGFNDTIKGKIAAEEILALWDKPDAIFAANDRMAIGAMDAIKEKKLRIPEDIALMGFDDMPEGQFTEPPLTTVAQPIKDIVENAARRLVEKIAGESPDRTPVLALSKPNLVIRKSA